LTNTHNSSIIVIETKERGNTKMKNLLKNLIGGIIGTGIIFLFFYLIGILVNFMETHLWASILMGIVAIISLFKI
jgi:hypothetical protein